MSSKAAPTFQNPTSREADSADIPALLSLVLTSFRQFPLFAFLYSPLDTDIAFAHDTIWYWRRRFLLDILNPGVTVLVIEAEILEGTPSDTHPVSIYDHGNHVVEESTKAKSWRMLDWVTAKAGLSQASVTSPQKTVLGFSIWKDRIGEQVSKAQKENAVKTTSWINRLQSQSSPKFYSPLSFLIYHILYEIVNYST